LLQLNGGVIYGLIKDLLDFFKYSDLIYDIRNSM